MMLSGKAFASVMRAHGWKIVQLFPGLVHWEMLYETRNSSSVEFQTCHDVRFRSSKNRFVSHLSARRTGPESDVP